MDTTARSLADRLERLDIVHQVENLMGRYSHCHATNDHRGCFELSAVDTPGVRADLPFGVYEGREGLERLYLGFFAKSDATPEGRMHMHAMTTPVIEVADDLQSAKGVWMSPGHATDSYGGDSFRASWRWTKYGCDFVKESDTWKIWHLHVYGIFATPYDKSWVESQPPAGASGPPPLPPEIAPDRPTEHFWMYRSTSAVPNEPRTPEPYATFQEADAY